MPIYYSPVDNPEVWDEKPEGYQSPEEWLAARPAPTPEELQAVYVEAIQEHLDAFARSRNYDNILSACTYATSAVAKFAAEGLCAVTARDATWARAYELLEQYLSSGAIPTYDELIAQLPALAWPDEVA